MALSRCLCLTLLAWILGSRPSAGVRTGSPEPGRWWGTPEARQWRVPARELFAQGNYAAAEPFYQRASDSAARAGDSVSAVRMLMGVAGSRFATYHYRTALTAYLEARRRALAAGDLADAAAVEANLASLYLEYWDVDSALESAERAHAKCALLKRPYFEAPLLVQLGHIHDILGDGQAERFYAEGIEAARRDDNVRLESAAWDYIGEKYLNAGDLLPAERAFNRAFLLRSMFDRARLPISWGFEGELKLAQGDLDSAGAFTARAIAARSSNPGSPVHLLLHQRGLIRQARGDRAGALEDFRDAVDLAERWRHEVPPSIASLTAADIGLERAVYDSFIETAAEESLRTASRRWLEESLSAVDANRGQAMRRTLSLVEAWRTHVRPEYWEVQARLRAESARLIRVGQARSPLSAQLSLQLLELESETKLKVPENYSERNNSGNSLIHFQSGLSKSEALLVFHLGRRASYLWEVTRERASLHRLPAAGQLRKEIEAFRDAVRSSGAAAAPLGSALYQQLFGEAGDAAARRTWLLSPDDALFDLPFAALVTERNGDRVKYLVEDHTLQVVPGALPRRSAGKPADNGWFLGVGDPIYNPADERATRTSRPWTLLSGWTVFAGTHADPLARLAGSATEVESSAQRWSVETSRPSIVLRGRDARRARFLQLATHAPSVIHLATHVLTPAQGRDQAEIAFGAGSDGSPEFLGASEVAAMHVPGALVVLSGCETGAGRISPGAGLLGLTRAWQMAGASGVVATAWPVTDSSGAIFAGFYRDPVGEPPAEALQRSQVMMLRSGGWRARPEYWAAYQLSGQWSGGAR